MALIDCFLVQLDPRLGLLKEEYGNAAGWRHCFVAQVSTFSPKRFVICGGGSVRGQWIKLAELVLPGHVAWEWAVI